MGASWERRPKDGRKTVGFGILRGGVRIALSTGMSFDVLLGRWLAFVRHPQAAWRRLDARRRAALVGTYAGIGYVGTLVLLITLR